MWGEEGGSSSLRDLRGCVYSRGSMHLPWPCAQCGAVRPPPSRPHPLFISENEVDPLMQAFRDVLGLERTPVDGDEVLGR
eukprot:scaffold106236_cov29-Tisochrysis_lutea.AAC.3